MVEGHGLVDDDVEVDFGCEGSGDACLAPGGTVTVVATTRVPLPWLPSFAEAPASIGVRAEHRVVVDRFREDRT